MEDFTSDKYAAWRKNFRVNSKTKSANRGVKELYEIILRDEYTDSDYWYFGGGANEFVHYLARFDEKDIDDLMVDIPNWTADQMWILRHCLTDGGMEYNNHKKTKVFEYQSLLLTYLFSVTDDHEIKNDIFENAHLIEDGKPKPFKLLMEIKAWADNQLNNHQKGLHAYNPNELHYELIEAAIQKASR